MKQADFRDMLKKTSKRVYVSMVVAFPDTLSPTPSTSSAVMTPKNTEEDPDDTELAEKGDTQIEHFSDCCTVQLE